MALTLTFVLLIYFETIFVKKDLCFDLFIYFCFVMLRCSPPFVKKMDFDLMYHLYKDPLTMSMDLLRIYFWVGCYDPLIHFSITLVITPCTDLRQFRTNIAFLFILKMLIVPINYM